MKGKFRWQMLIKGKSTKLLHHFARELAAETEALIKGMGVNLDLDVDPVFIL